MIIDAGLSAAGWEYESLAQRMAAFTQVYTYDRAGYGWSDPGPRPRTSQQVVAELRTLLQKAQVKPPYILVGHSWGGLNVRLYASLYPDEVAGLVLMDALNMDLFPATHRNGSLSPFYELLDRTACLGTARLAVPFILGGKTQNENEAQRQRMKFASISRTKTLHAIHDELAGQDNWLTVRAAMKHLGDKRVVVISRRYEEGDSKEDKWWFRTQQALTNISANCKFIVAQTKRHDLAGDRSAEEAVREMVDSFRSGRSATPSSPIQP